MHLSCTYSFHALTLGSCCVWLYEYYFRPHMGPLHLTLQASQRPVAVIVNKLLIDGSVVCFRHILTAQISLELIGFNMDMQ